MLSSTLHSLQAVTVLSYPSLNHVDFMRLSLSVGARHTVGAMGEQSICLPRSQIEVMSPCTLSTVYDVVKVETIISELVFSKQKTLSVTSAM